MAIEVMVQLEDKPGQLARLGEVLGKAKVNILALHGHTDCGHGTVRFIPSDPDNAQKALTAASFDYQLREVLLVHLLDEPGKLGEVAGVMAHAGINIDSVYVTTGGIVVFGVDDLPGAMEVAGGMAVMRIR